MHTFQTYSQLGKLSQLLQVNSGYETCWKTANELTIALTYDFKRLFELDCFVQSLDFTLGDSTFKQSASAVGAIVGFGADDELKIHVECLIDHDKVMIKLKQRAKNESLNHIANRIESQADLQIGRIEMRDLK